MMGSMDGMHGSNGGGGMGYGRDMGKLVFCRSMLFHKIIDPFSFKNTLFAIVCPLLEKVASCCCSMVVCSPLRLLWLIL